MTMPYAHSIPSEREKRRYIHAFIIPSIIPALVVLHRVGDGLNEIGRKPTEKQESYSPILPLATKLAITIIHTRNTAPTIQNAKTASQL